MDKFTYIALEAKITQAKTIKSLLEILESIIRFHKRPKQDFFKSSKEFFEASLNYKAITYIVKRIEEKSTSSGIIPLYITEYLHAVSRNLIEYSCSKVGEYEEFEFAHSYYTRASRCPKLIEEFPEIEITYDFIIDTFKFSRLIIFPHNDGFLIKNFARAVANNPLDYELNLYLSAPSYATTPLQNKRSLLHRILTIEQMKKELQQENNIKYTVIENSLNDMYDQVYYDSNLLYIDTNIKHSQEIVDTMRVLQINLKETCESKFTE